MSKNNPNQQNQQNKQPQTADTTSAEDTSVALANEAAGDVVEVKELTGNTAAPTAPAAEPEKVVQVKPVEEASYDSQIEVVERDRQVNARCTAATDIIISRINRHIDFLASKISLDTEAARNTEQVSFIETIGECLKQDYERHELVADVLLKTIRENLPVFSTGLAFRFMPPLEKKGYPAIALQGYRAYIDFLVAVAKNWNRRNKLNNLIDVTTVTKGLAPKAQENITRFFNKLAAA